MSKNPDVREYVRAAANAAYALDTPGDPATTIAALRAELAAKDAEIADLRISVIAFCGPAAAQWAHAHGLPPNHLHPTHYDILAKAGARMVDFIRTKEPPHGE